MNTQFLAILAIKIPFVWNMNEQIWSLNMAQNAKISRQVQLKCCGHKFYELFKNKMGCVFQMFPEICSSWKVLEGNEFAHVRVIHVKYVVGEDLFCPLFFFFSFDLILTTFKGSILMFLTFEHILLLVSSYTGVRK